MTASDIRTVVVERDGKTQTIDLKLPKTIPAEAIVN